MVMAAVWSRCETGVRDGCCHAPSCFKRHRFVFAVSDERRHGNVFDLVSDVPTIQSAGDDEFVVALEVIVDGSCDGACQMADCRRLLAIDVAAVQFVDQLLVAFVVIVAGIFAFFHEVKIFF